MDDPALLDDISPLKPITQRLEGLRPSKARLHEHCSLAKLTEHRSFSSFIEGRSLNMSRSTMSCWQSLTSTKLRLKRRYVSQPPLAPANASCCYQAQHKQQWEMAQRESEVQQLQQALSDMQASQILSCSPLQATPNMGNGIRCICSKSESTVSPIHVMCTPCILMSCAVVLRLYAENDRLKIQEIEDRKKIQRLISA